MTAQIIGKSKEYKDKCSVMFQIDWQVNLWVVGLVKSVSGIVWPNLEYYDWAGKFILL